jgi:polysaccharide biosynthesis protein PslH
VEYSHFMTLNLKILQLTRKVPWPFIDGESMAIRFMFQSLDKSKIKIDLLSMNTSKHFVDELDAIGALSEIYNSCTFIPLDNQVRFFPLLWNLILNRSYHISRFNDKIFHEKLVQHIDKNSYDIIQIESLFMAPYIDIIRKHSNAKIVLRAHNVEWLIWRRIEKKTINPLKKLYLMIAWRQLRRYEKRVLSFIDALIPISPVDADLFKLMGYNGPVLYFPIGIDASTFTYKKPVFSDPLFIHFIGSMDWVPNQEGVLWFIKDIWPEITSVFPNIFLRIAGRNTPDFIRNLESKNIEIVGEVPDAATFVQSAPLSIVPLLSGGGMRAKIIEAMALGAVVISTRIGAEGIPAIHQEHILIADSREEFLDALTFIFTEPDKLNEVSFNARKFVEEHFDANKFGADYYLFLENLKNNSLIPK